MKVVNKNEFEALVKQGEVVLVDFFATWCGPCKMLSPVLEEFSEKYAGKLHVVKVDVDQEMELARAFRIMSVPTMIVFKDGKPQDQFMGYMPLELLEQKLAAYL